MRSRGRNETSREQLRVEAELRHPFSKDGSFDRKDTYPYTFQRVLTRYAFRFSPAKMNFGRYLSTVLAMTSWAVLLQGIAQEYSIDWYTLDGGGGTSTGSVYSITGTIGQPDPGGAMTNGPFSITGGLWVLPAAIQEEGAPVLAIAAAMPGFVTISWTPATPGFVLQEATALVSANWTNSASGATNPTTVSIFSPAKFYRVSK
jgi:hypothetical protein